MKFQMSCPMVMFFPVLNLFEDQSFGYARKLKVKLIEVTCAILINYLSGLLHGPIFLLRLCLYGLNCLKLLLISMSFLVHDKKDITLLSSLNCILLYGGSMGLVASLWLSAWLEVRSWIKCFLWVVYVHYNCQLEWVLASMKRYFSLRFNGGVKSVTKQ